MPDKKKILPAAIADQYQVLDGHGVGEYHFAGHVVNLDRLTPEDADFLVKKGFPYLVAKEPKTKAKNSTVLGAAQKSPD